MALPPGQRPLALDTTEVLNMRVQSVEEVAAKLLSSELEANLPKGKVTASDVPKAQMAEVAIEGSSVFHLPFSIPPPMSLSDPALRIVLYEGSGAEPLDGAARYSAVSALLEKGYAVTRSAADRPVAPADRSPLLVLGRFHGQPPEAAGSDVTIRFQDISALAPAQLGDAVETVRQETNAARHGAWKPWFPVIDYDRCTNCMQCLSFCLFGVYGVDGDKHIQVQNNDNCKTNCPACSRVCPRPRSCFRNTRPAPSMATWSATPTSPRKR